jgi:DNA-directed RNA polymerase subunit N (RpoN/RPB10)
VTPRSLELKLEAKKSSMEEAMRCELKLPVKRTARIRCGGRVPIGALASRNPVEGDDRSPSSWAAVEDNDLYIWDEQPKERTPEGPNGDGNDGNESGNDNGGGDDGGDDGGDNGDEDPFGLHPMCCWTCRQSIGDLYTSVDECLQAMEAMKHRLENLEHVVGDNYKFLNRNMRKLFGMVGNMRGKWCNTCLKYH